MDYIDGTDAAQLLRERYPAGMPVEFAIPIITAVASGLFPTSAYSSSNTTPHL